MGADWVTARLAARAYGNNPLTLEFITFIHANLARRGNASIAGKPRYFVATGGDYTNPNNPVEYTDEQIKAIRENPFLSFEQKGDSPNIGFIKYPNTYNQEVINSLSPKARYHFDKTKKTAALVEALLMDLCDWYNEERTKHHNPYGLAAELQRRYISIHPFEDVNGRTSRLLMNWSFENDGANPSILFEPGDDILLSQKQWAGEVKDGSRRFGTIQKRKEQLETIGYPNIAEMIGLSEIKTFYDLIYKKIESAPSRPQVGEVMNTKTYKDFIGRFQKEYQRFQSEFTKTRVSDSDLGMLNYTQGGLIPQSYLDLIALSPKDAVELHRYLKKHYFRSDRLIYRGGVSTQGIEWQDVLRMFEQFVGVGSGYKALNEAQVSPVSISNVPARAIVKSLERYNELIANAYLGKHYPYLVEESMVGELRSLIDAHNLADQNNIHNSPFTSTSFDRSQARYWSENSSIVSSTKSGVEFSASPPNYGGILAFGDSSFYQNRKLSDILGLEGFTFRFNGEAELMVPGGIHPASIEYLIVSEITAKGHYCEEHKKWEEVKSEVEKRFEASKEETKEGIFLHIKDLQNLKEKLYKLNSQTGRYEIAQN